MSLDELYGRPTIEFEDEGTILADRVDTGYDGRENFANSYDELNL